MRCPATVLSTLALILCTIASAQPPVPKLEITADLLPDAKAGQAYSFLLKTNREGSGIDWMVIRGNLPMGVHLTRTGEIKGLPTVDGDYRFTVRASALSDHQMAERQFLLRVPALLLLQWKQAPRVTESTISGVVYLSNNSDDAFDLTLIVVGVNEIGRATALGYERFSLPGGSLNYEVPFETAVPGGRYVIHADAVAEVPSKQLIRRARLQTDALPVLPEVIESH